MSPLKKSLVFLLIALSFSAYLIKSKPKLKVDQSEEKTLELSTVRVHKSSENIEVKLYGTVEAKNELNLRSQSKGRVFEETEIFPGKFVKTGEVLYHIDSPELRTQIVNTKSLIRSSLAHSENLEEELELLKQNLEIAKELALLAQEAAEKQKLILDIEKTLFENSSKLYASKNISESDLLKRKSQLKRQELSYIQAQEASKYKIDSIKQIEKAQSSKKFALKAEKEKLLQRQAELTDFEDAEEKNKLKSNFPGQISKIYVSNGQDLQAGSPVVDLRASDKVWLNCKLADSYFYWLYQGDLLKKELLNEEVELKLVNQNLNKSFKARLKAFGDKLNVPTRSLNLFIERENPLNANAYPQQDEELKPGSYCELNLKLAQLDDIYLVPRAALQENQQIFAYDKNNESIIVFDQVSLVFESEKGLFLKIENAPDEIDIIKQKVYKLKKGQKIKAKAS